LNREGWKIIRDALKECRRMAYGLNFPHEMSDVDAVLTEVEEILK
jgi:hypothetical protein